ncbi:MAG: ester cyclase [Pseudomonadota bacterium]
MKRMIFHFSIWASSLVLLSVVVAPSVSADGINSAQEEQNKRIAREFYDDLWFNNRTDNYGKYMADTYVAHDVGDRKNVSEPAIEQKYIADFFWENGTLSGQIDYQIADGDLVATRWVSEFEPETVFGRLLLGKASLPIINVFRIENGKIVELWNHRHDIDTRQTLRFTAQGLLLGLLIALAPLIWAIRLRRRLRANT